jgi:ABC-type glycerol-3-phosphate transport system substrate-binding protein
VINRTVFRILALASLMVLLATACTAAETVQQDSPTVVVYRAPT